MSLFVCGEFPYQSVLAANITTGKPGAAIFVSKQAPVVVSLQGNVERLQGLGKEQFSKLKTGFFANTGVNYRQDVEPWLGNEITLAVTTLDIDRDPDNGKQPGYLMALATNAPEKSQEFLQLLFSKRVLAGADLGVEEYAGIKLISDNSQLEKGMLAGAVVGDKYVLFANDAKVLREAVNNVQAPDLNLTTAPEYVEAAKQVSKDAFGVVYLNLPAVAEWQGLKLPVQTFDSQIISLALNSQGLLAETAAFTPKEVSQDTAELTKPVGALEYIPPVVSLVVSGTDLANVGNGNLAAYWQQLVGTLSSKKDVNLNNFVQPLAEIQNLWGIDLAKDVFSWVQGEYAVALLPNPQQNRSEWVFVAEKTPATADGILQLDAIASRNGLSLTTFTLDNQSIVTWTKITANSKKSSKNKENFSIEAKAYGVHTTIGNYEVFTSSLETMHEVLTTKDNSFGKNSDFQKSIAVIPKPNQGYIYIDWVKSKEILEKQLPILKLVKVVAKPFLEDMRSLTISSYGKESNLLKGGILFKSVNN
nr:DUF3352 domain-containing protein [Calothrix sp. PCC 6303]